MRRSKRRQLAGITQVSVALLLLLAIPAAQACSSNKTQSQLSLTISGGISDAGIQHYTLDGRSVVFASILGLSIDPSTSKFSYTLEATVRGGATGNGNGNGNGHNIEASTNLNLPGTGSAGNVGSSGNGNGNGNRNHMKATIGGTADFHLRGNSPGGMVDVSGHIEINDGLAAEAFPLGCTSACTSQIPAFFLGGGSIDITVGHSTKEVNLPMQMESAFLNPFGKPIILSSTGGEVVIVATYDKASIDWSGVETGGQVFGALVGGGTTSQVSGLFSMDTRAHEDLVKGTEDETATMAFLQMTPSSLDASGDYTGHSVIPTTGTIDCSASTGIPGTCTLTGFQSSGKFTLQSHSVRIAGTATLEWLVPAVALGGTATATVQQSSH